jgi:hypothetical protein
MSPLDALMANTCDIGKMHTALCPFVKMLPVYFFGVCFPAKTIRQQSE